MFVKNYIRIIIVHKMDEKILIGPIRLEKLHSRSVKYYQQFHLLLIPA